MRCPNEVLSLKWSDIDWKREEITVTANKTEHHQRALEFRAKTDSSPTLDVTCCGTKSNHQEGVAQKAAQSASVESGNSLQKEVIDFWREKLKQAVTSFNYKVLRPVSDACKIVDDFSKTGLEWSS